MYLLEKDLKFPKSSFLCMKYMPFELKPSYSMKRVLQWHDYWDGNIYISFSGGLDSTILAYVVCMAYQKYHLKGKIPLVFCNTKTEFPELRLFTKDYVKWLQNKFPDLDIERVELIPTHDIRWVFENKGFPIISKYTASKIKKLRYGKLSDKYRNYLLYGDERGKFGMLAKKWQYLADKNKTQFDISDACCEEIKKKPFKKYVRETGRQPFIGITQDEGFQRENQYNHTGCNVYNGSTIKSQPLGFWTKQDVLQFALKHQIPICSVYGDIICENGIYKTTKEQRTGCVICGFGCHLEKEPNRLQRLACTHQKMYDFGMNLTNHGITYKEALHFCGIPTKTWEQNGQMNLFHDFE